jgi:membrane dipeptidase
LDDRELEALTANGGVIQVVAVGQFLKGPSPERREAMRELAARIGIPSGSNGPDPKLATAEQRKEWQAGREAIVRRYPIATLEDYVDHVDHAVKVAGVDHVGIGSDFDGGGGVPGFENHGDSLNITVELVRRGYSEEEIRKIWGGNLIRVWRKVVDSE